MYIDVWCWWYVIRHVIHIRVKCFQIDVYWLYIMKSWSPVKDSIDFLILRSYATTQKMLGTCNLQCSDVCEKGELEIEEESWYWLIQYWMTKEPDSELKFNGIVLNKYVFFILTPWHMLKVCQIFAVDGSTAWTSQYFRDGPNWFNRS